MTVNKDKIKSNQDVMLCKSETGDGFATASYMRDGSTGKKYFKIMVYTSNDAIHDGELIVENRNFNAISKLSSWFNEITITDLKDICCILEEMAKIKAKSDDNISFKSLYEYVSKHANVKIIPVGEGKNACFINGRELKEIILKLGCKEMSDRIFRSKLKSNNALYKQPSQIGFTYKYKDESGVAFVAYDDYINEGVRVNA